MITRLRRTHRITWLMLAIVLPVVLALAVLSRRPIPPQSSPLPAELGKAR